MRNNTKTWPHGLLAEAIGSFSTAAGGVLTLPSVFNLAHEGLINLVKITLIPAPLCPILRCWVLRFKEERGWRALVVYETLAGN